MIMQSHHRQRPYDGTIRFSTGIMNLDLAINGGLEPGELFEIYGKSSTGKSQMCQTILTEFCHNRQKPCTALYIDTKNDLIPSRLFDMFKKCSASMRRVRVLRESKAKSVLKVLKYFEQEIVCGQSTFCENFRLIIVDSLPTILYGIETENNDSWRSEVENFIAVLKKMAAKHGLIIIIVNHAVSNLYLGRSSSSSSSRKEIKPALGKPWINVPHFRMSLSRLYNCSSVFRATLEKSSREPGLTNHYFDIHVTDLGVN